MSSAPDAPAGVPGAARARGSGGGSGGGSSRRLAAWFALLVAALAVAGAVLHQRMVAQARARAHQQLAGTAALKTGQIVAWRAERLADVRLFTRPAGPLLSMGIIPWVAAPADAAVRQRALTLLEGVRAGRGYQAMLVATPAGELLGGVGEVPAELGPQARALVALAAAQPQPLCGEVATAEPPLPAGAVRLDVAGAFRDAAGAPLAVPLLRSVPERELFPLVQAWPTPSASAETMLVRREGDDVVFLNPLRHIANAPLALRRPLAATDVVAVKAVLGETGIVEGRDYRGVEVVADLRAVPDSNWLMVAKVDADEILAQAHREGAMVALFTAAAVITVGLATLALASVQRRNAWRALYQAEHAQRLALDEYRATLQGIGDGVLSTDADGHVRRMNPVAEAMTGWRESEAQGRPVREVFAIINEDTRAEVESPVVRVLREGQIVGLANHTLLIARDGSQRPIADSGAPVRLDDGTLAGVVLVFRDQSAERAAHEALRASEVRFRRLFEGSADALLLLDIDQRRFIDCNVAAVALLGLDERSEVLGTQPADLSPALQPDGRDSMSKAAEMIDTAYRNGFHRFEWMHCSRARAPFPVDVLLTPIEFGARRLALTSWRDLSEAKRVAGAHEAAAAELAQGNRELARFNAAAVDRELRMVKLKAEVDALCRRLGEAPRYGGAGGEGGQAGAPRESA